MTKTMATKYVPQSSTNRAKHRARDARRAAHKLTFIGVDGEGVGNDYVMLSVGEHTLHRGGKRLTHADIFPFLYEQYQANPLAVFVGFALTYDFTMWLKGLTERDAYALYDERGIAARRPNNGRIRSPFPVRKPGGLWEFDLMGNGKRFRLRPNSREYGSGYGWLYVSDVFGYWQTSFVNAIDPAKWVTPVCTPEEYEIILEGKAKRSTAVFNEDMQRYNVTENRVLARAMAALNEGLVETAGVKLKRSEWFGPGQAAQKWLANVSAPTRQAVIEATPGPVRNRAIEAYYGGWFENLRHGLIPGELHSYDLLSAYPAVISELPCLLHGEWRQLKGFPGPDTLALVYGDFYGVPDSPTGPLPYRTREGHIQRPLKVSGCYWWHEIQAARRAGLLPPASYGIKAKEIWAYYPRCHHSPPLASIRDLYAQRLAVDKASPQGKAIKVIMNSAYGKMAQTIGEPLYSNMLYAGIITSLCRSRILDAIAVHPGGANSVLMVNTDGITFDSPNPNLELSTETLGAWEHTTQRDLCLFMPGVYWEIDQRAKIKRRGMPRAAAQFVKDEATRQFADWVPGADWPVVDVVIPWQFITGKLAYSRGKWESAGTSIYDGIRRFNSLPIQKRQPANDSLTSTPYQFTEGDSTPYRRAEFVFGWQEQLDSEPYQGDEWRAEFIETIKPIGGI